MFEEMNNVHAHRRPGHERLSGQDSAFLSFERSGRPMHLGALAFFATGGWRDADGGLDTDRMVAVMAERARVAPALGKRLAKVPVTGWPAWVRADGDNPAWQFEVTAPAATREEVRRIAEEALSTPLDREHPLWRVLIVPGLDGGDAFALVFLAHHALVDGIAGIDLLAQLLDGPGGRTPSRGGHLGVGTSQRGMLAAEVVRWVEMPTVVALKGFGMLTSARRIRRVGRRGKALVRTCVRLLTPGPRTALRSGDEGGRQLAWFSVEEEPLRYARKRLNGTPNDIVLAAVAEAIGAMGGKDGHLPFRKVRAAVPVSFRTRAQRYDAGNRLGLLLTPLEIRERAPGRRVGRIRRHTELQKQRGDAEGYEVLCELTGWTGLWSQRLLHWLAGTLHSYGVLVTNVPGPSRAYTLGGSEMQEIYPLVPLFGGQAVSVAVIRYQSSLQIGVTASWGNREMVEEFSARLEAAFGELTRATADSPVAEGAYAGDRLPGVATAGS
jgi:WS/DGAT/MGAT family acyltransferase